LRAEKLDRMINIERLVETIDALGVVQQDWVAVLRMRAQVLQATQEEFIGNYGRASEVTVIFRIRFIVGITPAHRVAFDGRLFDIQEIIEIGRRYLELHAVARTA
jgi:SPP1 family predicted phage head-tail adaptor